MPYNLLFLDVYRDARGLFYRQKKLAEPASSLREWMNDYIHIEQ